MDAAGGMMQRDPSYSPDVELDHLGRVVFARNVKPGETIMIPMHMMRRLERRQMRLDIPTGEER